MTSARYARYWWLLSQLRFHDKAALATKPHELVRWTWHARQAIWFERQIMKLWKLPKSRHGK